MNNINKLYTYTNTNRTLNLLEFYIEKILNPMSKKLKFIPDFDLTSQDLLYTAIKYVGIKEYDYSKIDSKELSYYIKLSKGLSFFTKQNKTIKTKKNLISYLINNLSTGNYHYALDQVVYVGNVIMDKNWLVNVSNFLINSFNLSDLISEDRYKFIYKFLEKNKGKYYLYEYHVSKNNSSKIDYHEQLLLYDLLKPIDHYSFPKLKKLNSNLNKEGYTLSVNKLSIDNSKANKEYIKNLPKDKLELYLNNLFNTSNRHCLKNRINMTETYELLRSLSHAYKEKYSPNKCRTLFLIDDNGIRIGQSFAKYFLNYIYDLKALQKRYHYNELNTDYLKVTIIDYRSHNYLGTLKKISEVSSKIEKQNSIINRQMKNNYTNIEILKQNAHRISNSCHKLYTLVKNKKELETKLMKYGDYNKGDKEYLLNYLTSSIFSYDYTYEEGVLHLSINNYSYNDTLFKLDIGIINFNNFINDEENLLLRTRFYREEEDSDE